MANLYMIYKPHKKGKKNYLIEMLFRWEIYFHNKYQESKREEMTKGDLSNDRMCLGSLLKYEKLWVEITFFISFKNPFFNTPSVLGLNVLRML